MLNNLRIGARMVLGFAVMIIFSAVIGIIGITNLQNVDDLNNRMYKYPFKVMTATLEAKANILAVHRAMKDVVLSQSNEHLEAAVKTASEYDAKVLKNFEVISEAFLEDKALVDAALKAYKEWAPIREVTVNFQKSGEVVRAAGNTKTLEAAQVALINKAMDELTSVAAANADSFNNEIKQANAYSRTFIIASLMAVVLISFVLAFSVTRSITKPVAMLNGLVSQAAKGDLTAEYNGKLNGKNEIVALAKAFNTMISNLRMLVLKASDNAATVAASSQQLMAGSQTAAAASEEIASSIQQVSSGAEKQNHNLNEVSSTMYELAQGTEQTAISIQGISNEIAVVNTLSVNGKNDLNLIIKQMNIINDTSKKSVNKVKSLEDKSKSIQGIIEVITDISGQTNLLALNAAIEAARAGEAGKGFAVVSDEIRKLAEQSANSTKEISSIVHAIQSEILDVIQAIEKEEKDIEEGLAKVNTASASFERIMSGIDEITDQVQDVTAVTQQMSAGTEQVVDSIKAIADISSDNAAVSEEVAASVEEQASTMEEITASAVSLSELSANLLEVVSKFKVK